MATVQSRGSEKSMSMQRVSYTESQIIWLTHNRQQNIDQRSDRGQGVTLGLNTISPWGGFQHTQKGNTRGTLNTDVLSGADETYARTLPKNK